MVDFSEDYDYDELNDNPEYEDYAFYYDNDWNDNDTDISSDNLNSFLKEEFEKEKEAFYSEDEEIDEKIKEFIDFL